MSTPLYKILPRAAWAAAEDTVPWAPIDRADGFLHLSAGPQLRGTAERHFATQTELVALELDSRTFERELRWEPSRGGELFPHVYGEVPRSAVLAVHVLAGAVAGEFSYPPGC